MPESTERAFRHALESARADVLELDVQRTKDGQFVVWHGPGLENVLIGLDEVPAAPEARALEFRDITEAQWSKIEGHAWVRSPSPGDADYADLRRVPRSRDREILSLPEFLHRFPNQPINLEAKADNCSPDDVPSLIKALGDAPRNRRVLFVSQSHGIVERFRKETKDEIPTGLSALEVARLRATAGLPLLAPRVKGRALQSTHLRGITTNRMIRHVQKQGGAVHLFITQFLVSSGLDDDEKGIDRAAFFELLQRGVDGVMTDRPLRVRTLIDEWFAMQ